MFSFREIDSRRSQIKQCRKTLEYNALVHPINPTHLRGSGPDFVQHRHRVYNFRLCRYPLS